MPAQRASTRLTAPSAAVKLCVMFGLGATELVIILAIVVLLFGARRLPEIGSGLGRTIRGFKEGVSNSLHWWEVNITGTVGRLILAADNMIVFYAMVTTFLAVLLASYLIGRSKFGLALRSIGESEEAAAHTGINVNRVKVVMFGVSAFFMGATGAVMSMRWTYIDPTTAFNLQFSFMPVLMAIFGGTGHLYAPIAGATAFSLLEELLTTKFPYYYMLLFGLIMLGVILFMPHGLEGFIEKWRRRDLTVERRRSSARHHVSAQSRGDQPMTATQTETAQIVPTPGAKRNRERRSCHACPIFARVRWATNAASTARRNVDAPDTSTGSGSSRRVRRSAMLRRINDRKCRHMIARPGRSRPTFWKRPKMTLLGEGRRKRARKT